MKTDANGPVQAIMGSSPNIENGLGHSSDPGRGGHMMEPLTARRNLENLGLQLLFAPVRSLLGAPLPASVPERKRRALNDFGVFLQQAMAGVDIAEHRDEGFGELLAPSETVKRERAYRWLSDLLPSNPDEAKRLLADLNEIRRRIAEGREINSEEQSKLYNFCRGVLNRLDQERAELLDHAESEVWA